MLVAALALAGSCSQPSADEGSSNGNPPIVSLSRDQVRKIYFAGVNAWVKEQDRTRPPAPSIEVPQEFSEANCTLVQANIYRCEYRVKFGRGWETHTKQLVRQPDGEWRSHTKSE